jgi:hypothetical protein
MGTAEAVAESTDVAQEGLGGGGAADTVVIHPYLFPWLLKAPAGKTQLKKQLEQLVDRNALSKQQLKEAHEYILSLDTARSVLTSGEAVAG